MCTKTTENADCKTQKNIMRAMRVPRGCHAGPMCLQRIRAMQVPCARAPWLSGTAGVVAATGALGKGWKGPLRARLRGGAGPGPPGLQGAWARASRSPRGQGPQGQASTRAPLPLEPWMLPSTAHGIQKMFDLCLEIPCCKNRVSWKR